MERKDLIELTLKLYKITLFFPKKESLRYKIRETANRILEGFVSWEKASKDKFLISEEIKKDVEVINSYLEVTKWQNWVPYFDILSLADEYDKMKDSFPIEDSLQQPEATKPSLVVKESKLTDRKKKIIEVLKKKEMVQVWEINKILPNVSKRTLRRDFEQLLKNGYVERIGEKNKTFYKLP